MKLFTKFSSIGAVLVLSTAFASATTYQFGSYATGAPNLGNSNTALVFDTVNSQPNPGVIYTPATQTVSPGIVWAPALPNSTWVSFGQTGPTTPATSMPGGGYPLNGSYFFTSTFVLDAQATAFTFSI